MILAFLVAPVPLLFVSAMLLRSLESVVDLSISGELFIKIQRISEIACLIFLTIGFSASKGLLKKSFPMLGFMEPALAFMQPIFEKLFGKILSKLRRSRETQECDINNREQSALYLKPRGDIFNCDCGILCYGAYR